MAQKRYVAGPIELVVPPLLHASSTRPVSRSVDDRCPECNGKWTATEARHKLGCRKAVEEKKQTEPKKQPLPRADAHEEGKPHNHSHDEKYKLTTESGECEISIFEEGVPPEFRIKFEGTPPAADAVTVKTDRGDQGVETFAFVWDESLRMLRSTKSIPEPHEFRGTVVIAGHAKTYTFEQKEFDEEAHTLAHKLRTMVYVTYFRIRVSHVDTVSNTFTCEVTLEMCWQDNEAQDQAEPWRPHLVWQNAVSAVEVLSETLDELSQKERLERPVAVAKCNSQLVVNAKGTFREPFNLYHFPFDRQYVSLWLQYDSFHDNETRDLFFLDATRGRNSVNSLWKGPSRVQTFANSAFLNQVSVMREWNIADLYVAAEQLHKSTLRSATTSILGRRDDLEALLKEFHIEKTAEDFMGFEELSDVESDLSDADDEDDVRHLRAFADHQQARKRVERKHRAKLDEEKLSKLVNTLALYNIANLDAPDEHLKGSTRDCLSECPEFYSVNPGEIRVKGTDRLLVAPSVVLAGRLERRTAFYMWNVILFLSCLVCLSGTNFLIHFEDVSGRLQNNLTLLLTVVAYKYTVSSWLPKTPYLTIMDKFVVSSFFLLMFISVGAAFSPFLPQPVWVDRGLLLLLGVYMVGSLVLFLTALSCPTRVRPKWSSTRPGPEVWTSKS